MSYGCSRALAYSRKPAPRQFALTPAAELLRKDVPGSLRGMAVFLPDPFHYRVYADVMESMTTGKPAAETHARACRSFEYLAKNPDYSKVFNDAMTALSAPVDWRGARGVRLQRHRHARGRRRRTRRGADVDSRSSNPKVRGILTDVGHVVDGAKPRIASAGLADRCQAVPCDFFAAVPEGGDAYIMKHIIHDWDDERATVILKNIGKAMGTKQGKVILLESVIAAGGTPDLGKFIDIEMLLLPGGRERSADEFRALFAGAGFEMTKIVPTKSPLSVVESRVSRSDGSVRLRRSEND